MFSAGKLMELLIKSYGRQALQEIKILKVEECPFVILLLVKKINLK